MTMNGASRVLLSALFVGTCLLQPGEAQSAVQHGRQRAIARAQLEALYSQGTKAMDEHRWLEAVTNFDRVAAANGASSLTAASLYWKAYSLDKLGRKDDSRTTCESLSRQQPSSRWNKECLVLQTASIKDEQDLERLDRLYPHRKHSTTEDEIRILALDSLIRKDPAKALPLLQALVKSDKPVSTREKALFVLSRSNDPRARALLTEAATTNGDPGMQRVAIKLLSLSRGKDANSTLIEVYRASADAGVKRAIVNRLFATHDAEGLVGLARAEKDLSMKRDIVGQLSVMHEKAADDYMLELLR